MGLAAPAGVVGLLRDMPGVLAAWQREGVVFEPGDYVQALRPFGRGGLLDRVGNCVRGGAASLSPDVGLRILAGDSAWREMLIQEHVIPDICAAIDAGEDAVELARAWEGVDVKLEQRHVRTIAHLSLAGSSRARKWVPLLRLHGHVAGIGETAAIEAGPAVGALSDCDDEMLDCLVEDVLRLWASAEMVPATLPCLRELAETRNAGEFYDLLELLARLVRNTGRPAGRLLEHLAAGFAVVVVDVFEAAEAVGRSLVWKILEEGRHGDFARLLGGDVSDDLRDWYMQAGDFLDGNHLATDVRDLRKGWALDVAGALSGRPAGEGLVPGLFRLVCSEPDPNVIAKGVDILKRVPPELKPKLASLLEPVVRGAVVTDPLQAVRWVIAAFEIAGAADLRSCGSLLLARLLAPERASAHDFAEMGRLQRLPEAIRKLIADCAGHLARERRSGEIAGLLWELALSPRERADGLAMRLQRAVNLLDAAGSTSAPRRLGILLKFVNEQR